MWTMQSTLHPSSSPFPSWINFLRPFSGFLSPPLSSTSLLMIVTVPLGEPSKTSVLESCRLVLSAVCLVAMQRMGSVRLVYWWVESLKSDVRSKTCKLPPSVPTHTCDSPATAIHDTSENEKQSQLGFSVFERLGTGTGTRSTFPVVESSIPIENPGPPWIKYLCDDQSIKLEGLLANSLSGDSVGLGERGSSLTGDGKLSCGLAVRAVSGTLRNPRTFMCTVCAPQLTLSSFVPIFHWHQLWKREGTLLPMYKQNTLSQLHPTWFFPLYDAG